MNAGRVRSSIGAVLLSASWLAGCGAEGARGGLPSGTEEPPPSPVWPMGPPPAQPVTAQPPPISGGTLLVLQDGHTAVASDPERDRVWLVDLSTQSVVGNVPLQAGDEPGRLVEDAAGRVHVVLRGGGALASIEPAGGAVTRRAVCATPRGLAYDASQDVVHVACADGVLATLPAAGGAAVRTVALDRDLRDVVVQNGELWVSRFRSAELLRLAPDGTLAERVTLPMASSPSPSGVVNAVPSVAYRTLPLPGGGLVVLHQRALDAVIDPKPGGYADFGMCPGAGIVHDTVSIVTPGTATQVSPPLMMVTLAVDLAVSADGSQVALAVPGGLAPSVVTYPTASLQVPSPCQPPGNSPPIAGPAVAVAFDGQNRVVAQLRDPPALAVDGAVIALPVTTMINAGHEVFHMATKGGIACASCHPEGGDDGRVWQFNGFGARRTQNIRGGVLARAPFHWSGDIPDMPTLASVVFEGRMVGPTLEDSQILALGQWMDALPALAPPAPADAQAVARGAKLFDDPSVGCRGCHLGPQLSNHQLVDVGTGGAFKVPSLIAVGYRAPFLHDGCAATLHDRFGATCGGADGHGNTQQLDAGQIDDLVAFLESL